MSRGATSATVQIAIALIGVGGSIAVAYITTGATFAHELKNNEQTVATLGDSVSKYIATSAAFQAELRANQESLVAISRRIGNQVTVARAQADSLHSSIENATLRTRDLITQSDQFGQHLAELSHRADVFNAQLQVLASKAVVNPPMTHVIKPPQPH